MFDALQMNILTNVDRWCETLTVEEISDITRHLGDSDAGTRGMVRLLIDRICFSIGREDQIPKVVEEYYIVYGDTREFFLRLADIGAPYLSNFPGPFNVQVMDTAATLTYLCRHPKEVDIDALALLEACKTQKYGKIRLNTVNQKVSWNGKPRLMDLDVRRYMGIYYTGYGEGTISKCITLAIDNLLHIARPIAEKFVADLVETGIHQPFPEIPGITSYYVYMDTGRNPVEGIQFPRLIYGNQWVTFNTAPYGLNVFDGRALIMSIDDRSPYEYRDFSMKCKVNSPMMRKLLYIISCDSSIQPLVDPEGSAYVQGGLLDPTMCILNLPSISEAISGIPGISAEEFETVILQDQSVIRTLISEGSEYTLQRYLDANPEVLKAIPTPAYGRLGYCIEDYITEEMWSTFPPEVTRLCKVGKLVENPYLSMDPLIVRRMAFELVYMEEENYDGYSSIQELLYEEDVKNGWFSKKVLQSSTRLANMNRQELCYYAAARKIERTWDMSGTAGMRSQYSGDIMDQCIKMVIGITNAGGIGIDEHHATPLPENFWGISHIQLCRKTNIKFCDDLESPPSGCYAAICKHFKIPNFHLISCNQDIKNLFVRGYIGNDYLSPDIPHRTQIWDAMSADQRKMIDDVYIAGINSKDSYVSRRQPLVEIEAYIEACTAEDVHLVVKGLGLVVPRGIPPIDYVRYSIHDCISLFEYPRKDGDFSQMTDRDILRKIDALVPYQSRGDLVGAAVANSEGRRTFFVPYNRKGRNAMTLGCQTPITSDMFTIAYGTFDDYTCYTLEELNDGFEPHTTSSDVRSLRIICEDYTWAPLTEDEVSTLTSLAQCLSYEFAPCDTLAQEVERLMEAISCTFHYLDS